MGDAVVGGKNMEDSPKQSGHMSTPLTILASADSGVRFSFRNGTGAAPCAGTCRGRELSHLHGRHSPKG